VDTEEEFDWSAPFSSLNTSVSAVAHIGRVQSIFDQFNLQPTYVVDYPVAAQQQGREPLQDIWSRGRCTIGAHLHPWVNPPYGEAITRRHSFLCNLPQRLQKDKLNALVEMIAEHFATPRVFKAGRYGLDNSTVAVLDEAGFHVDTSLSPRMNYRDQEGPAFENYDALPFFLTPRLLELPLTIDYTGWTGALRPLLHRMATAEPLARVRAAAVLIRIAAVNRIGLSPEGNTLAEMKSLTSAMIRRGCRTFCLCFHSPSVVPGCTPYVRTQADLGRFLATIERFLEFFMHDLHGVAASLLEFRQELLSATVETAQ